MIILIVISVTANKEEKLDASCDNATVTINKPIVVKKFDKKQINKSKGWDDYNSKKQVIVFNY